MNYVIFNDYLPFLLRIKLNPKSKRRMRGEEEEKQEGRKEEEEET